MFMSINGSVLRASTATQAPQTTKPAAIRASVRGEPQPHAVVSLIPNRNVEIPTLISAPLFHAWGFGQLSMGLLLGSTLILQRRFDPERVLQAIQEHRPTALVVVPVMLDRLLAAGDDPDPGSYPEDRRHQSNAARDLITRELVADDAECERKDPAADALDHPRRDQERERVREGCEQRPGGEEHERPEQDALLAVHVAEAAEDRGAH